MRKRVLSLAVLVSLILAVNAQAVDYRAASGRPSLSFNGPTAFCFAHCKGENPSDELEAELTLYQGDTYVDSWSNSGVGPILVSGNCTVKSGRSYRLVLTWSINGSAKSPVTVAGTCP